MSKRKLTKINTLIGNTNVLSDVTEKAKVTIEKARKELDQINMTEISINISETILNTVTDQLDDSQSNLSQHIHSLSVQTLDNKKVRDIVDEVLELKTRQ
jgi:DNA-binding transcriptional ArsR family regulator